MIVRYNIAYWLFIVTLLFSVNTTGQNVVPSASYCSTDGTQSFYISAPPNKTWTSSVNGVITNTGGGNCTFEPSAVPGPYPVTIFIHYQNPNYTGEPASPYDPAVYHYRYTVVIQEPGAVTFNPVANTCVTDAPVNLTALGVPALGTFAGTGVVGNFFDPAAAGAGSHNLSYTYPSTGCNATAYQIATVEALPAVTFTLPVLQADVCINAAQYALVGDSPAGGTYSGVGVVGGTDFNPAVAGVGTHTITYTYTNATGCVGTATDNITVYPLPTIKNNVTTDYCAGTGGGTLVVQTIDAGTNYMLYNNTSGVLVGTQSGAAGSNITFSGLPADDYYIRTVTQGIGCSNNSGIETIIQNPLPIVTFTLPAGDDVACNGDAQYILTGGNPAGGSYSGAGVNLGSFNPSAGAGSYTITYTYSNGTCSNTATDNITVYALPNVTLTVPPAYDNVCIDEAQFALTGGLPIGGTYYIDGVASINFNPVTQGSIPSPHVVTYSYTNANSCTNTATDNITVHDLPVVGIVGLNPTQCDVPPSYTFAGNNFPEPPGATSTITYTGAAAGLTDNGDGSALFDPTQTGLGNHTVTYDYTDANGCSNTTTQIARVGTQLGFINLNSHYCGNVNNVTFTYWPGVSTFPGGHTITSNPAMATLVDNGNPTATATFDPSSEAPGIYTITYTYFDDLGCENIYSQNVSITADPTANIAGISTNYCNNAAAITLTGVPAPIGASTGVFTTAMTGLTDNGNGTATFTPSAAAVGGPINITYTYNDVYGCTGTYNAPVTINEAPTATISGNATICSGVNTNLTFNFTGGPIGTLYNVTYTDGAASVPLTGLLNGQTQAVTPLSSKVYTVSSVSYAAPAFNSCTNTGNGSATIVVTPQVSITSNLSNVTVCENGNANFTITATGTNNLQYEWFVNGVSVQSGFSNVLVLNNRLLANNGDQIYCVVSSTTCGGTATSSTVTLTVNPRTAITTNPVSAEVCDGASHTFTVAANGIGLTYRWQKFVAGVWTPLVADANIPFVAAANLQINNLDNAQHSGFYRCQVTGTCGAVAYSGQAELTVNDPIVITTQPVNISGCELSNILYSVSATGTNLSYQWYFNDGTGAVALGTNSTQTVNNVSAANVGSYYCVVSSPCGETLTSNIVTFTLLTPPSVTNPVSKTICEGSLVSFSVSGTGSGITYQWYRNGVALINNATVSGVTTPDLAINPVSIANAGNYRCEVTGTCGVAISNAATLVVEQAVTVVTQPIDIAVCPGSDATFLLNATGTNITYDWQFNGVSLGAASVPNYTVVATGAANAGNYRCRLNNVCGNVYSNEVLLTVNSTTTITDQPDNINTCEGSNVSFSVTATGTGVNYEWYKNGLVIVPAQTNSVLSLLNVSNADGGNYHCEVTGVCNSVSSVAATLVADIAPVITTQPQNAVNCQGQNVNITVVSSGTGLSYQWYFNDGTGFVSIGANSPIYNIPAFGGANQGNYYCTITNNCGTITTNTITRTLGLPTVINTHPSPVIACVGDNANFSVSIASGTNLTYQWRLNGISIIDDGVKIIGANTANLSVNGVALADAGSYSCRITGSCTSVTSNSASLTINEPVAVTQHPANDEICEGENTGFSVIATGTALNYQWYHSATGAIVGALNSTFSLAGALLSDAGDYYCTVSNGCNSENSNAATLVVNELITINASGQPNSVTACTGANVAFSVTTATGTNLNYRWQLNGVDIFDGGTISGASTKTLTISGILPANAGNYTCVVSNSCHSATSLAATLTVNTAVNISVHPQSQTACQGQTLNLITTATGTSPTYLWYKNSVAIAPAQTNPVISIAAFAPGDEGNYYCAVNNSCGTVNSNTAVVSLGVNTVINTNPVNTTRCVGNSVTFNVSATGSDLTYVWRKDAAILTDDGRITAVNTNSLSIDNIQFSDFGEYTCDVIGSCGTVTSLGATLTVRRPPVITTQPLSDTVCNGTNSSFNIIATGDELTYSWQLNGVAVGVATSSILISPATAVNQGVYNCIVSTPVCGQVVSTSADLVVYNNLTVNTQPANTIGCEGENISFSINISASPDATRQWYKNGIPLVNGGNISGALSDILSVNNISNADAGNYYCELTSRCGSFSTNTATLTVNENVVINVHPTSFTILNGNTANFTVVASGNIVSYQWYKNGAALVDGGDISGATTDVLSIANTDITDQGAYTCEITGTCVGATSKPANLIVVASSLITIHPATPVTKCRGESLNLSIVSSGTTFQWRKDGVNLVNGVNISGVNTQSLTVQSVTPVHQGAYTCFVNGVESSLPSVVTVNDTTQITIQPIGASYCSADNMVLSVVASGSLLGYEWFKNNAAIVPAQTNSTLIINPLALTDAGSYYCVVTGICGTQNSNPATITVSNNTVITTQPTGGTICEGTAITMSVAATGSSLTYQWYKNGILLSNIGTISGSATKDLTITGALTSDAGSYTCIVSGTCSSATSNAAIVNITPKTAITVQPANKTACIGDNVTLNIIATGSVTSYQWYRNGVPVGASAASYSIAGAALTDAGTYSCSVNGVCGTVNSNSAVLTINELTVINSNPTGTTICENNSTALNFNVSGSNLSYQWFKDGTAITDTGLFTGSTTPDLNITNAKLDYAGIYSCAVTALCGNTSSNSVQVTVNPQTRIIVQPQSKIRCETDNVTFTVIATGTNLTYVWQKNNVPLINTAQITGVNTPSLNIISLTQANSGDYNCVVTGTCGSVVSNAAALVISQPVAITTNPVNSTICEGLSTTLSITATGSNISYQWFKGADSIFNTSNYSGANSDKLVISNSYTTNAGTYTCVINGSCYSQTSTPAIVTVNPTTIITNQPTDKSRCLGDNALFSIITQGTNLTYQWKLNNAPIPLATTQNLTVNPITAADAGAYTCDVWGTCNNISSDPADLIVLNPPTVDIQPVDANVCKYNTATFSANVSGAGVQYQWQKNGINLSDGAKVSGSTTGTLDISTVIKADEGVYRCNLTGTCGNSSSSAVLLRMVDSTEITVNPNNVTVVEANDAFFNIAAVGDIVSYRWQKNGVDIVDGGNISGATTALLNITAATLANEGSYRCVVTGVCGTKISSLAELKVNVPVSIITNPVNSTKCVGESVSFSVSAIGTNLTYIWQFNGSPLSDNALISGVNTPNLVINTLSLSNAGTYSCVISGSYNQANSVGAILTVNEQVNITQHPLTQTKCEGDNLIMELISSSSSLNYQWTKNNSNLTNGGKVSGATSALLVISNIDITDEAVYRCAVSNICGSALSNPGVVTIDESVSITLQPANSNRCVGNTANFTVSATGENITYQWYHNGVAVLNSSGTTGANSNNLIINNLSLSDAGNYSCYVSNGCSNQNSTSALLTVNEQVVINSQPTDKIICQGADVNFVVSATGYNLSYQWQKDGVNLADVGTVFGSSTSVLLIQGASTANAGIYRCLITGGCNNVLSNSVALTVNLLPGNAGIITGKNVVCQGEKDVLYIVPAIANAVTYNWTLPYGATIVSGLGTRSVKVNYSKNAASGVVSVYAVNSCGNGTVSPGYAVTVNQLPDADAGFDQIVCGATTNFAANSVVGIWSILSGDAVISNNTLFNSALTAIQEGVNEFVWTVTQNGCSNSDTVLIENTQIDVQVERDKTICDKTTTLEAYYPLSGANWTVISGAGFISNINSPTPQLSALNQGLNSYGWTINNKGCISTGIVNITNDRPNTPKAGTNQIVDFSETPLDAEFVELGTTGTWSVLSGSGLFDNANNPKTRVTNLAPGTNKLLWSVQRNNCILGDTVLIENIFISQPEAGPNQIICNNSTLLDAVLPDVGTSEWSVKSGAATFADKYNPQTQVTNLGPGDNWLYWTVRTSGQGMEYDSVLITNYSTTTANAGPDVAICNTTFTLMANTPIYGSGVWTLNSGAGTIVAFNNPNSVINNLGAGKNDLKWTITNNNCISEDYVTITNNIPTTANAGLDQTLCDDSTLLLPNTPTVGKGSWSVISGSGTFNGNYVTNLAPDNNVLRYTITQGTCTSFDDINIINNKPTTPSAGYDQQICTNSISLNANLVQYGTGMWTVTSGAGTFSSTSDSKATVTNMATGKNIYRWTITKNGCAELDEVTVSNDYVQAFAGNDITVCTDDFTLQASNPLPGIGTWSIVGTSGAIFKNQNNPNTYVSNLSNGANSLRWTIVNGTCESYSDITITSNKPTKAWAGENKSVCANNTQLNANQPIYGSGMWTVMSGSGTFDNATLYNTTVRNLGVGINTIRWTITEQNCSSFDEATIINNLATEINGGNDQQTCSDSAELDAVPLQIGTGFWSIISGQGIFDDATNPNTMIRQLGKGNNILLWKVSSSDCHLVDTVIISSKIPSTAFAGADQIICIDSTKLAGNTPVIGTGEWVLTSGAAIVESPNVPNSVVTSIAMGRTTLRWTINEGGCYSYDEMVLVNNQPSDPFAGYDTEICGDSVRLYAEPPVVGIGHWSLVSGDAVIVDRDTNQTRIENITFGKNTFRWTVTNGNCVMYDDVVITNNKEYVFAGQDIQVSTSTVQLIANKPANGIGRWIPTATPAAIQTPASFETMVTGLGAGTNEFTWTITNNGCISSDGMVVDYVVMPIADFEPSALVGCPPMSVNFVNTSIGGAPYTWDFGDGQTSSAQSVIHVFNEPGKYKVVLKASAPLGKVVEKDTIIVVNKNPVANFDIAPKLIYIPDEHISCYNYSQDAVQSIWYFGDGNAIQEYAPIYYYNIEGIFDISLKAISATGCTDSITKTAIVQVIPRSRFFFPQAFTPSTSGPSGGEYDTEDRSNDVFYPIITDGELTEYEMLIYNKTGVLIFKTDDVKIGWDGYYKNKLMPKDVYVYIVSGRYNNGQFFKTTGNVLLIEKER